MAKRCADLGFYGGRAGQSAGVGDDFSFLSHLLCRLWYNKSRLPVRGKTAGGVGVASVMGRRRPPVGRTPVEEVADADAELQG